MNTFEMVVLIVALVMIASVVNHWIKAKSAKGDPELAKKLESKISQVDDLEKRVKTLEKIVTDKRHKLAEEIDSL